MAYSDYDTRYTYRPRHESSYHSSRDTDLYSRRPQPADPAPAPAPPMRDMRDYDYSYDPRYAAPPRSYPSTQQSRYRSEPRRRNKWPPSPTVEDATTALARELPSSTGSTVDDDSGEAILRGTVDQYPILEEIERPRPRQPPLSDDRRFVIVSDPSEDQGHEDAQHAGRDRRRKSFAERGKLAHLKTDNIDDAPLFAKRTPSPYAYTKPQKESLAPSAGDYLLSPESIVPGSVDSLDAARDQNARPARHIPTRNKHENTTSRPPSPVKNDVFDDSDTGSDTTHLRTERRPARYSFVKSDLQKEHLRTNISEGQPKAERRARDKIEDDRSKSERRARDNTLDGQIKPERRTRDTSPPSSARRDAYAAGGSGSTGSSGSSKQRTPPSEASGSYRYSSNKESRQPEPAPIDTRYASHSDYINPRPVGSDYINSRPGSPRFSRDSSPPQSKPAPLDTRYASSSTYPSSRPSSPRYKHVPSPPRSPRLPPRRPVSPSTERPTSSSGRPTTRPEYPQSPRSPYPPAQPSPHVPITEADWHATYPPVTDGPGPYPRPNRYDTMPVPMPSINVKSPSPARQPKAKAENPLPYPVDDRPTEAFMPPEERYQYDHSYTPVTSSPRLTRMESPLPSPRERQSEFHRPSTSRQGSNADEIPRSPRLRSNSTWSQHSNDGARRERKATANVTMDKPLPSCPRAETAALHDDWYTLRSCPNFDLCPSCYQGVFADTPFSVQFSQTRLYERPAERVCDFGNPWMRLAWLLIVKQKRQSIDLLYTLARVSEQERQCPGDRGLGSDHIAWYGIQDPRDGLHVNNFAICPYDLKMVEALFPSMKGYFTRLPPDSPYAIPTQYNCSLRLKSRRFPKYLDLLVELDAQAQTLGQHPNMQRFMQLARENAYKTECARDKQLYLKPWHFIPALPEMTVCQECFEELIWPGITSKSSHPPSTIPKLFNRTIQPVPNEDPELGSSCCLYSPRMREVWERAVAEEDFAYLEHMVLQRRDAKVQLGRERRNVLAWMDGLVRGTASWEVAKRDLRENEEKWKKWE